MIKLTKISKQTNKTRVEKFESYDELEKRLIKLSSAHYEINNFHVSSSDFEGLVSYFKETYNPNYYVVDDIMESIIIIKLKIGEKRKSFYKKKEQTKKTTIQKAIKRLERKYDIIYDKDLGIIEVQYGENKIIFELNEEEIKIENVSLNGVKIEVVKDFVKVSKDITKYFDKLGEKNKLT